MLNGKNPSTSFEQVSKSKVASFLPKPEKYSKEKHGRFSKVWFDTVTDFLVLSNLDPKSHLKWYFDGADAFWLTREVERLTKEGKFDLANL